MEVHEEYFMRAKRQLHIADHMIYMTYNLVRDPKLLLSVMDNIFLALTNAITAVLHYEHQYKEIPRVPEGFEAKFLLFKEKCARKSDVDEAYFHFIREVKDIIMEHKTSPVEFRRHDTYIICTDHYKMRTISIDKIKSYLRLTKDFIQLAERSISLVHHA